MNEQTLFAEALERADPQERAAFLHRACQDDPALRARIERLLAQHEHAGGFLESPPVPFAATTDEPRTERPGVMIGVYKLVELIGEGGMGAVWMAQQTEPVKRLVAAKLIKAGMDSRQVVARFEAERQALALMDHPNIARVLDAGTTESGRPYFVMDLVKGVPITRYCDEHRLTPRQRLELFVPVCSAVQHAHQKGIIHRDLKPSNVLVALYDGKPVPKVIDFGVAKAAGQPLTDKTLVTGFGAIVGTLEYMSPEQAELNQLDVDTRSDVYSLGVLLYELLTGSTPFSRKEAEKGGVLEMLRVIREQEPTRPSTKLSTAEGLPTMAANRGTEPGKLTRLLRGELDWIVLKALEKDRSRRYETASAFAADVQRYLADEPVQACPPSAAYRLGKFARRHRGALTLAGVVLAAVVVLAVGGVTAAVLYRGKSEEATQKASEATQNLDRARASERRSLASEAHALLGSWRPGLRSEALRAIARAAELGPTAEERRELRDLVFAALAQPDLELDAERPTRPPGTNGLAFDARYERYARSHADGTISVRRVSDDQEVRVLTGKPAQAALLEFEPKGRYLAVGYPGRASAGELWVWDLRSGAAVLGPLASRSLTWAFAPGGNRFARVVWEGGVDNVVVVTVPDGREEKRIKLGLDSNVGALAFHPDGETIAFVCRDWTQLVQDPGKPDWVIAEMKLTASQAHVFHQSPSAEKIQAVAWNPDGTRGLAWGTADRVVNVTWGVSVTRLSGHARWPNRIAFTPDGRFVVSAAPGDGVYVWGPDRGQPFLALPHEGDFHLRPAGDVLGAAHVGEGTRLCRLVSGPEVRTLTPRGWMAYDVIDWRGRALVDLDFTPDGRLLAAGQVNEVELWDVTAGQRAARVPMDVKGAPKLTIEEVFIHRRSRGVYRERLSVAVAPDGKSLAYGCRDYGLHVRPVRATADGYHLGPPAQHATTDNQFGRFPQVLLTGAGPTLAGVDRRQFDRLALLELGSNARRELNGRGMLGRAALTADGVLAAAGSVGGRGTRVWEVKTGAVLRDLEDGDADVAFRPDGRRLVTGSRVEYRVYDTTTWDLLRRVPRANAAGVGPVAFSGDGSALAVVVSAGSVGLFDADGEHKRALLPVSRHDPVAGLRFSRDGAWLAIGTESGLIHLWDLRRVRDRLRRLGLDWEPPLPPADARDAAPALTVEVEERRGR